MVTLAHLMQESRQGAAMAPVFNRLEKELAEAQARDQAVDKAAAFLARRAAG
ncbi:hypothetical protein [uncultured Tateyamaria sp.]|uniref:hypothetical protein n=1 Tax=uncultured Tateyamaria sp. TaxID=455651 RepID=UPI002602E62D|nr:hypothetical protein [uncultured Tateyamaria sp.]